MATYVVKLPDVGEGLAEAQIVKWHVNEGDSIRQNDPLVDVTTDKATVEIPSPVAGRIVSRRGEVGDTVAVGAELIVLDTETSNIAPGAEAVQSAAREREASQASLDPAVVPNRPVIEPANTLPGNEALPSPRAAAPANAMPAKPLASPAVRRRAREGGIPLHFVDGTGSGGRILPRDLEEYMSLPAGARVEQSQRQRNGVEDIKISGVRRTIAERMETARRIPHFSYIEEVDVTAVEALRRHLNAARDESRAKLTILSFVAKAVIGAVARHPQVNATFDDAARVMHCHAAVHLGIATQTVAGLMVPVIRHAEALSLWELAAAIALNASLARDAKISHERLAGSTITITSLGRRGGVATTPIINHPEVAIVGANRIVERPVLAAGGIAAGKCMNLSSSFDHRVVDGWDAAEFVQTIKTLLEQPATLFMS